MDGVGENDKGGTATKVPFFLFTKQLVCFFDTSGDFLRRDGARICDKKAKRRNEEVKKKDQADEACSIGDGGTLDCETCELSY